MRRRISPAIIRNGSTATSPQVFGDDRVAEATAMASRAPLDLRVNTLKAKRDKVLGSLKHLGATETPWSPLGLRIDLGADARNPGIHAEEDFIKGAIEVQDEGSQLAALLSGAKPGEQVIDLCAGAGGKTLALAAMMQGKGRLIATDHDKRQLAPIYERLSRAGVHNADIRTPKGPDDTLADIHASADLVVIDAPCTGTGTWRRNPDAKWRMRPGALEVRIKDQIEVLDRAVPLVKPGGRIAYITCSVLPQENNDQIRGFLARHPDFSVVPPEQVTSVLWDKAEDFAAATLQSAGGPADDPAADRHGRVFRQRAEAQVGRLRPLGRHCEERSDGYPAGVDAALDAASRRIDGALRRGLAMTGTGRCRPAMTAFSALRAPPRVA